MIQSRAKVVEARPDRLVCDVPGWPGQRPGQFAMLGLEPDLAHRDPLLPRPMAVYRSQGERVEFRFKVIGRGTAAMARSRPGDALSVVGPLGNGFEPVRGPALLIGGGTGIASLYQLAREASVPPRLVLGGRTRADILGLDDFTALGAELRLTTEDGSAGTRGRVTDALEISPDAVVYACGPTPMMAAVAARAAEAGARCWVSLENPMACGFGICLGCVTQTRSGFRYTCTHGPVFDAAELEWEES